MFLLVLLICSLAAAACGLWAAVLVSCPQGSSAQGQINGVTNQGLDALDWQGFELSSARCSGSRLQRLFHHALELSLHWPPCCLSQLQQTHLLAQRHLRPQHTASGGDGSGHAALRFHSMVGLVEVVLCQAQAFSNVHDDITILGATGLDRVRVRVRVRRNCTVALLVSVRVSIAFVSSQSLPFASQDRSDTRQRSAASG